MQRHRDLKTRLGADEVAGALGIGPKVELHPVDRPVEFLAGVLLNCADTMELPSNPMTIPDGNLALLIQNMGAATAFSVLHRG